MDNALSEKRQYYRVSLLTRGIMLLGGIIFLGAAGLSYSSEGLWTALGFLGFGLLSLGGYISINRSVYISQSGIGERWFWSESFMRWEDIGEAKHKSDDNLTLISADQMIRVKITGMLQNYGELVDVIRQVRPGLWQAKNLRVFHVKIGLFTAGIMMTLGCLGLGLAILFSKESGSIIGGSIFLAATAFMVFATLHVPIKVELAENELVIHRLAGKRRIPKNLLERMSIGEIARVNTVAMQGVTLWVRDPRKNKTTIVQFNNIKEGSAAFYASLMDWNGFVSIDSPQL